jgi:hypothetical protein
MVMVSGLVILHQTNVVKPARVELPTAEGVRRFPASSPGPPSVRNAVVPAGVLPAHAASWLRVGCGGDHSLDSFVFTSRFGGLTFHHPFSSYPAGEDGIGCIGSIGYSVAAKYFQVRRAFHYHSSYGVLGVPLIDAGILEYHKNNLQGSLRGRGGRGLTQAK